ncbi:MAG: phospholipase D-like domain-containing protein, partial [Minisyncoccales bacterium]
DKLSDYFIKTEEAIADMSDAPIKVNRFSSKDDDKEEKDAVITPLLGKNIKKYILEDIKNTEKGEIIYIAMLFISDRHILKALKTAIRREVKIIAILDNNEISFDQKRSRLPNAYLMPELQRLGVEIRWYKSEDDEFHSKMLYFQKKDHAILHIGSANLTRRSLIGTNLENNVRIKAQSDTKLIKDVENYFKRLCSNKLSVKSKGLPKNYYLMKFWCKIAERVGLSTW